MSDNQVQSEEIQAKILFLEDEQAVLKSLMRFFERQGFKTMGAQTPEEAIQLAQNHKPDIAILDVMLHEGPSSSTGLGMSHVQQDGYEVCKKLRELGFDRPVIFLTACSTEQDKLIGFEMGADDYVTKPFSLPVLLARVRANLRRVGGVRRLYRYGPVEVDLELHEIRHTVTSDKGDVVEKEPISRRERDLLAYLIQHPGRILSREQLLEEVWGYKSGVHTRTVDTHVLTVRKKLRDNAQIPKFIQTHHGVGYQFIGAEH